MEEKLKVGDVVKVKLTGSPSMVLDKIYDDSRKYAEYLGQCRCIYFHGGLMVAETISLASLVKMS